MGTQTNRLDETILLSTYIIGFDWIKREIFWGGELYTRPYLDHCIIIIIFNVYFTITLMKVFQEQLCIDPFTPLFLVISETHHDLTINNMEVTR